MKKEDVEIRTTKILFAKNGNGYTTTRITLPVPWVKEMGFDDADRTATLKFDGKKIIINKEDFKMEGIILEKAYVQYDQKGNYDFTIESKYTNFDSYEEAKEYVEDNIEEDVEYYFYKTQEDVDNSEHFEVVICNNYDKERIEKMMDEIRKEVLKKEMSLLDVDNAIKNITGSTSSAFDYIEDVLDQTSASYSIETKILKDKEININFDIVKNNEDPLKIIIWTWDIWEN